MSLSFSSYLALKTDPRGRPKPVFTSCSQNFPPLIKCVKYNLKLMSRGNEWSQLFIQTNILTEDT